MPRIIISIFVLRALCFLLVQTPRSSVFVHRGACRTLDVER